MKTQKKKTKAFDRASELYNKYFDEYYDLEKETKEKLGYKFKSMTMVSCIMKHQMKIMMNLMIMMKKNILIYLTWHH